MSRSDAEAVRKLHKEKHGVDGMAFSINCMHIFWKNCPVAWQGMFQGMKGSPTIVCEAGVDYNGWFWHFKSGFPGAMNDKTIWGQSPLHRALETQTFDSEIDPIVPFSINNKPYTKLWFLVDGIYPRISRFVHTIPVPSPGQESHFAKWQESARKDVERGFGILQSKYRFIARPIELHHLAEIDDLIVTCIIMHNMMVHYRVETMKENEMASFYYSETTTEMENLDPTTDAVEALMSLGGGDHTMTSNTGQRANVVCRLSEHEKNARERQFMVESWLTLNDKNAHAQLTYDIMKELKRK